MIRSFAELVHLPTEATESLEGSFNTLLKSKDSFLLLLDAMDDYYCGDEAVCACKLQTASEQSGIHRYALNMLFLILCAKPLRYIYKQKGLPDQLYVDAMSDLKYKLLECKKIYGIWGTFVFEWFRGFYLCERFQLGRLQYERIPFPFDLNLYEGQIQKNTIVYNCHIPSSGDLTPASVIQSLKKAYAFYRSELKQGILPVVCLSWILYPPFSSVFSEESNLKKFYKLFRIIHQYKEPENQDFWRIFGQNYTTDSTQWAEETQLQRKCKKYLLDGSCMGEGFGILLFDGNEICSKNVSAEERI
mgnify:CR=1 FL=1